MADHMVVDAPVILLVTVVVLWSALRRRKALVTVGVPAGDVALDTAAFLIYVAAWAVSYRVAGWGFATVIGLALTPLVLALRYCRPALRTGYRNLRVQMTSARKELARQRSERLDPLARQVWTWRSGIDGSRLSEREVAERLGLPRHQIRAIYAKAMSEVERPI